MSVSRLSKNIVGRVRGEFCKTQQIPRITTTIIQSLDKIAYIHNHLEIMSYFPTFSLLYSYCY